jgi:type IV pilus assembly protein PilB
MMNNKDILALLLEKNILSKDKADLLEERAQKEGVDLIDLLVLEGISSEEKISELQASYYSLPYIDLQGRQINPEAMNVFSGEVAQNYKIICFENKDGRIKVGITDPGNFKAIEAIDFLAKGSGLRAEYYLMSKSSFELAFKQYKSIKREIDTALKSREEKEREEGKLPKDEKSEEDDLKEITKSAPVVKIVSVIIRHAIEGGASDIHIEPIDKESRVRYRIDGILHTSLVLPRNVHDSIIARIKVMANMKLDETRIPQDGRIKMKVNDQSIDFRVSSLPLVDTEKIVMRILYTNRGAPKLDDLGYMGEQLKIINRCTEQTEGIILVTGPTGSGKSTTLFGLLDLLNKDGVNISTLEDPVEYQMKGISQSQIKPEIGYTFSSGLRSFLRQDPDIIMVGEIRDEETGELSIHAALTGHLVLSTIHTTSALGAIARLVDMKVEMFLLGSTLNTIIAQRLVRKICANCKKELDMPKEVFNDIKEELKEVSEDYLKELVPGFDWNNLKLHRGAGCPTCGNTGYSGRICISEVVDVNEDIKKIILEDKIPKKEDVMAHQIYTTMKQDGYIKVILGHTTLEEVLRVMRD